MEGAFGGVALAIERVLRSEAVAPKTKLPSRRCRRKKLVVVAFISVL